MPLSLGIQLSMLDSTLQLAVQHTLVGLAHMSCSSGLVLHLDACKLGCDEPWACVHVSIITNVCEIRGCNIYAGDRLKKPNLEVRNLKLQHIRQIVQCAHAREIRLSADN